ncbi:MAG: hypothetical protein QOD69_2261 [Solirubrobacteraceae bacterium]|jgi:hypothetical protein|nr:hypothetical protein [Solirubrobacteraceae bacterium]
MSPRDRIVALVVAAVAAVGAIWFLAVAPKRQQAAGLGAQVAQAEQRRDEATTRAAAAEATRATYGRDYATIARLGKAVPPRADVASLVFQLETVARAANVDFRSVSVEDAPTIAPVAPAPPAISGTDTSGGSGGADAAAAAPPPAAAAPAAPATDVQPRPFTFGFEGDYLGLQRLLAAIDRFSRVSGGATLKVRGRLLTIDGVSLTAGRSGLPQVKAQITARAYVADLPSTLSAGGSHARAVPAPTPASQVQVTP